MLFASGFDAVSSQPVLSQCRMTGAAMLAVGTYLYLVYYGADGLGMYGIDAREPVAPRNCPSFD